MKDTHDRPVGKKFDQGKPRWDLVPYEAMSSVVDVLTHGAAKYGDHNWLLVDDWKNRYFAAAQRHLIDYFARDHDIDDESGLPHLAHAACCLLFLLAKEMEEG